MVGTFCIYLSVPGSTCPAGSANVPVHIAPSISRLDLRGFARRSMRADVRAPSIGPPHVQVELRRPAKAYWTFRQTSGLGNLLTIRRAVVSFRHTAVLMHINQKDNGNKKLSQSNREHHTPLPVKLHRQPEMDKGKKNHQIVRIHPDSRKGHQDSYSQQRGLKIKPNLGKSVQVGSIREARLFPKPAPDDFQKNDQQENVCYSDQVSGNAANHRLFQKL